VGEHAVIAPDRTSTSPHSNAFRPSGIGVVIHATRSGTSMNPTELEGTLNWFKNPGARVSSHWVIGRNGEKVRVIPDDRQAWHAGEHNATHWGIEVEQGIESDGFTPEQMHALVEVCKGYVEMGVPAVHAFSGFIGHQETPQGKAAGKSDPGGLFKWDVFINNLRADVTPPGREFIAGDANGGIENAGNQVLIWNNGLCVLAIGDYEGTARGQIAKLFGDRWYWLRQGESLVPGTDDLREAVWSTEQGD
jgi:N-acetylmuramoyl-L-alanine amidase